MVFLSLGFEFHAILGNCTNDSSLVKLHHIRLLCDTYLTFYTFVIYIKSSSINPPPPSLLPGSLCEHPAFGPCSCWGLPSGGARASSEQRAIRKRIAVPRVPGRLRVGWRANGSSFFPTDGAPLPLFAQNHGLHIHGMHLDKRRLQDVSDSKFRKLGCACLETAHNPLRLSAWRPQ